MSAGKQVHIGCAAGFAGDRFDAGIALVAALAERDGPRYLIYETLGERTLALAQLDRRRDPEAGCTPDFESFLRPVLRSCVEHGIRIVANFGAANPPAAGRRAAALARELGIRDLAIAVVEGDDLLAALGPAAVRGWPNDEGLSLAGRPILAANAYLGAEPIRAALAAGAGLVLTGRCTDSALALGPLRHEHGWPADDWDRLAAGTLAGHLLECGGQVTGGYFADPGRKDVPDLGDLGFPIATVDAGGTILIGKPAGTGGLVSEATVKEQLLYEIHDPAAYLTPDVTLDLTGVEVRQDGPDRVRVTGAAGRAPPATLKVTVSVEGGFLGEGEIGYAGPGALARAELAAAVLRRRLERLEPGLELRCDIIGTISLFDSDAGRLRVVRRFDPDGDYRLRLAARAPDRAAAERAAREVLSLYCCGPAGGGGVRTAVTGRINTVSCHVPADLPRPGVTLVRCDD
ncbi:MAG: acyclic terpene utilization AtuA family protein [Dongiaceae bacterium]